MNEFLVKVVNLIDETFAQFLTGRLKKEKRSYRSPERLKEQAELMKSAICEYIDLKVESYLEFTKKD